MKLIECHNLETAYAASLNRPILNGINCHINEGEFVALLGLNGAGKSTLLRSLVGLVPLVKGEIHINGLEMTPQSLPKIRREIGMLFQGGGLIRQLSAIDNVLCGRLGVRKTRQTLFGFPKHDRTLAIELLEQLGLKEQIYQKTSQLSGGQQQRVAIARALIQSPQILLADEPITGLDVVASQQVMQILSELNAQHGLTIVTVLHDLGIAAEYAQRAIVLDAGRIVYDGECDNLQAQFSQVLSL
ncbi:phosphonate ABC transporter ATP-binding protein [Anabaena cylindrica FACHB-243]|uniref:Phosphonate-transporting ATPase n=1 Tax=Anabaena cylindrica (strain ATCC 27899 / PCC 7122) TaxID=272123 RepID=K9ZHS2_ANACC|nr:MULTISPECIES: phosphonate ABC transporter ATP-binding protein [Anabaena]AFZ58122.1 Phosphonate-transporting ATPase [Anabaena cylindrica PCC 7122]MBD2419103.1 phosphonate ABC transporter ATP-binding protein [Anabaena cylindrica FACHB-243]MBY5280688.1 phosphonate ABC transporter ATP-binding protein [Anabaena sp. CCAP 1446/1C]MBY5310598.1 phosphonate ABC transporter ATP-binding protein [Anabaena sp. CCAP 1446/1C]MCM2409573.1 phosphonate ABC transporter ATP-binding protein [Anabaena sp. CCAP 14